MAACQLVLSASPVVEVNTTARRYSIRKPELIGVVEMSARHKQDIWSSTQELGTTKEDSAAMGLPPPHTHPLLRRTPTFMTPSSLELCTETLGSETGSDGFSDMEEGGSNYHCSSSQESVVVEEEKEEGRHESTLKYRFPPPLPSITHSEIRMRAERREGRLVMEALPLASKGHLCSQRQGDRLVLSFIDPALKQEAERPDSQGKGEEEEVEEVERSTAPLVMGKFASDGESKEVPRSNIAVVKMKKAAVGRKCGMWEHESVMTWEPYHFITSHA